LDGDHRGAGSRTLYSRAVERWKIKESGGVDAVFEAITGTARSVAFLGEAHLGAACGIGRGEMSRRETDKKWRDSIGKRL